MLTEEKPQLSEGEQLSCLRRIEAFVERFFSGREVVDLHELAMKLWQEDNEMPLWLLRLRCISATKTHELDDLPQDSPSSETLADSRELVNSLCSDMPPMTKHIFYLRFWKDLSVDQIAASLGCQPKAIRASLRHWLFVLRTKHEQSLERTPQ